MVNSEEGVIRFEKRNFGQLEQKQRPQIQESVLENPTFWLSVFKINFMKTAKKKRGLLFAPPNVVFKKANRTLS